MKTQEKKFSVLYVDDEESNLRIFKNTFRKEYNIFLAKSAKDGIEVLNKNPIDLVLTDQRMPEISGVEFLKYILENHPNLNRILITGYTDFDALRSAVNEAKIFQYIQKPWSETELKNVIDNALNVYSLEKKNIDLMVELQKKNELLEKTIESLKTAKEKAEEGDRLKSRFLQNISHEIRTPMNGIIGFSRLMTKANITEQERHKFINIIIRSANQLLSIVENVMMMASIETNQEKINLSTINISDLIQDIYDVFRIKAESKGLELVLSNMFVTNGYYINSDETKIKQVISNLLDNAIKFTNSGQIKLSVKTDNDKLIIEVSDTGIGISKKDQDLIFERFYKVEHYSDGYESGTGLGLSIVKAYVKLLGGEVKLRSSLDKGTVFTIEFDIEFIKDRSDADNVISSTNEVDYTNRNVLVAEDEDFNFMFLEHLLLEINANVLRANNGIEAVELCKSHRIDLILMDIKMPVMDGLQASSIILEMAPEVTIIAQSAYASNEDKELAKKSGCIDFLVKPVLPEELYSLLKQYRKN